MGGQQSTVTAASGHGTIDTPQGDRVPAFTPP
jgi:hypothetical protein